VTKYKSRYQKEVTYILLEELLKEQKKQKTFTKKEFANRCSVSLRTVQHIEKGNFEGSFSFWINASKILGVDINLFIEDHLKRKASL